MPSLELLHQLKIMTPYAVGAVNGWLLPGDEPALVDVGPATAQGWEDLMAGLTAHSVAPADLRHIILTHAHIDHYGNAHRLATLAPHARIYAPDIAHARLTFNDDAAEWQRQADFSYRALLASGLSEEIAHRSFANYEAMRRVGGGAVPVTDWLYGGEMLVLGAGLAWEVVPLPGHSMTQIGLWCRAQNWFISADHLLPRISSNALLEPPAPGERRRPRALPHYVERLQWMATLPPQTVFPGHGDSFTDQRPLIQQRLVGIEERAEALYTLLQNGPRTVVSLVESLFPTLRPDQLFLAVSEVVGHLDILEAREQVIWNGDKVRYYMAHGA